MYLMWPWLRHRAQMPMCEQRPRSASYSLQSKLLVNCQACCPLYGIGRILLFSFSRVSSAFPAGRLLQQPARLAVMPEMWQTFDASPDMSGQLPKQQQILSDANGADCQPAASAATSPVSRCMDPQQVPDDPDSAAPQTHQSSPHAHTHSDTSGGGGGGWWGRSRGALGSVAKGYAIGGALLGAAYLIASACNK
ncbi:TPA: hypothetical protein ACH3X3_000091 [Trebouxia sp. C0006]